MFTGGEWHLAYVELKTWLVDSLLRQCVSCCCCCCFFFNVIKQLIDSVSIRNNQNFGKCYQLKPSALVGNIYLDLDYSGYHKNFIL